MKRSGMIRRIIISLMIITFLSGSLGGLAEGILPSLTKDTGTAMPSIAEALQRNPDSETKNADGSVTEYYANVSKQDYETFSVYLKEQGAALADYKLENNVLTAEIQANGASFFLTYDFGSGEAATTYPAGTYGKKAQGAETEPAAEESKGVIEQYKRTGNIVTFGVYEQDDLEEGPEAIEWIVLDYDEKEIKALLISEYGLDTQPYNAGTEDEAVTWETCSLRRWLNSEFKNKAFTRNEQAIIPKTEVDNSASQGYGEWKTNGGNDTQDRIFLLSYKEAEHYFGLDSNNTSILPRVALTPYLESTQEGQESLTYFGNEYDFTTDGDRAVMWWLRSPGQSQQAAASVGSDGRLDGNTLVSIAAVVVRPAIWLDLVAYEKRMMSSAEEDNQDPADETTEENSGEAESKDETAAYKKLGNIVTFGRYEQDNNLENGLEPIEWIVLEYDGENNRSLLISKYGLDTIIFDEWSTMHDCTWEDCRARKWLSQYFLYSAFNKEERKTIPITEVDDSESQERLRDKKRELQKTQDQLFLLSYKEAEHYLGVSNVAFDYEPYIKARVAPTAYAIAQGAYASDEFKTEEGLPAGSWLLRTYAGSCQGINVNQGGTTNNEEFNVKYLGDTGVHVARPAFWLDLNAAEELLLSSAEKGKNDENPEETKRKAIRDSYSRAGNTVTYGHYEQDNDPTNGPEPIEWLVLTYDEANNRAMLISRYGLDTLNFHIEWSEKIIVTWETCTARKWLNNVFLYSAFNEEERKAIPLVEVDNSDSLGITKKQTVEVNNTFDRVFLLSKTETTIYFNAQGGNGATDPREYDQYLRARVAPTPYAIAKGAFVSDQYQTTEGLATGKWPLRTSWDSYRQGETVSQAGSFGDWLPRETGSGTDKVARPVFWLDLDAVAEVLLHSGDDQNHDENPEEAERKAKTAQYTRPGNTVTFGHYEQDNDPANGPEAIEWIVLTYDEANSRVMLVSKYGLDVLEYDNVHRFGQHLVWEICSAREWLNDTFLTTAFSAEEQKAIPITELDNSYRQNPKAKLKGELNNTQDRVFLLSVTEAGVYFNLGERNEQVGTRVAPTPYAIARGAYISEKYQTAEGLPAGQWQLRTPYGDYSDGMTVFADGKYERSYHKDKGSGSLTVARPAIWLDLDADIF